MRTNLSIMLKFKVLVGKLVSVNGFPSGAVMVREVASLLTQTFQSWQGKFNNNKFQHMPSLDT